MKDRTVLNAALLIYTLALCGAAHALDFPSAGKGSIEFTVTPKTDEFPLGKNPLLLHAVSADGSETYEVHLAAEDLVLLREFGECMRAVTRTPHNFKKGAPRKLLLAWNGPSTRLYIDGKPADDFNLQVADNFYRRAPAVQLGVEQSLALSALAISANSPIAADKADAAYVSGNKCPNPGELFKTPSQETFRNITLHNFPDQKSRDIIKKDIALLPQAVAAALKRIIFVEPGRYQKLYWKGQAYCGQGVMMLQATALEDPGAFFHEAAHLYDYAPVLSGGAPLSRQWQEKFMPDAASGKQPFAAEASVLDRTDSSTPHEELAAFAASAYSLYLKTDTAVPPDFGAKLQFLLEKGLINKKIYDAVRLDK